MDNKYINIHQDLIDACAAGDRKAQFEIYKRYYKAMYNTSLRIVNNTAEAEDILQECFLDAFRRIGSYSGEGSFGSWLKRIVVNRSLDHLRKHKEIIPLEEMGMELSEESSQAEEDEILCRVEEIKKAIAKMPDDFRVILSLILFEGYDHDEVSRVLNITNQLSRTRYSRARQRLIQMLKKRSFIHAYSNS